MRSLVASRLDGMVQEVASLAITEQKALGHDPKKLVGSGEEPGQLREQPVWGMDSYTRYNIRLALEDSEPFASVIASLETDKDRAAKTKGVAIAPFDADPSNPKH